MTRLTEEETEAVRLDQLSRIAADRMRPVAAGFTVHYRFSLEPNARRAKTRYHVLVRPLESGRLRLVLAASRRIGEIRGVATWLVGDRFWVTDAEFDFHGMAGWMVDWRADAPRGQNRVDLLGKPAPVWPWAPLANATAAMDTPWEWICRASANVEEKSLPLYFAAAARFPRAELLAKAGLAPNWLRPSILEKLDRDAALARFVAQNAQEIAAANMRPLDVVGPFRRGATIAAMRRECDLRRAWENCPTPGVDFHDAERYLEAQRRRVRETGERGGATAREVAWVEPTRLDYSWYISRCHGAGLDVRSRSVAFPKSLSEASARLRAELARRQREANARAAREAAERVRSCARRLAEAAAKASAAIVGVALPPGWSVVVPACHEEFYREGRDMSNCIGSGHYTQQMADGLCVCVFITGPAGARADAQITFPRGRRAPCVAQLYARHNSQPPAPARRIARDVAQALALFKCKPDKGA